MPDRSSDDPIALAFRSSLERSIRNKVRLKRTVRLRRTIRLKRNMQRRPVRSPTVDELNDAYIAESLKHRPTDRPRPLSSDEKKARRRRRLEKRRSRRGNR